MNGIKHIILFIIAFTMAISAQAIPLSRGTEEGLHFSVASFTPLPNDVSAFISPIRDLNDEACALIKVVAPADFAFSTPLGIVKREDKTGEIWLWVPSGTKELTIKHPEWGVIRDYQLGTKLESRMTYEMRLNIPQQSIEAVHDTITLTKTVTDTVKVAMPQQPVPLSTHILLTSSFHTDGPSWGIMFMMVWRHGFFVHATSDLHSVGNTRLTCDKEGNINDEAYMPFYTGSTRHSCYTITGGAAHRLTSRLTLFEGMGYGRKTTAWQLAESEGGGYALNDGLTHKGFTGEAGLLFSYHRLSLSASVMTIAGKQWMGSIGIGVRLGKK